MYDLEVASLIQNAEAILMGYLVFCLFFAVGWYLVTFFIDLSYEKREKQWFPK